MTTPSRANAAHNVWEALRRRVAALVRDYPRFPSLRITKDEITPQGAFAEAQAQYLSPDQKEVRGMPCSIVQYLSLQHSAAGWGRRA